MFSGARRGGLDQRIGPPADIDGSFSVTGISCPTAARCVASDDAGNAIAFDPTDAGSATSAQVDTYQMSLDFNGKTGLGDWTWDLYASFGRAENRGRERLEPQLSGQSLERRNADRTERRRDARGLGT